MVPRSGDRDFRRSMQGTSQTRTAFEREVESRFGVLPHFFRSAPAAPELVQQLWIYAQAAYLDNPLPALFKERVFVYLSRFCEIRYCLVRHVGFLVGLGRPSGDPDAMPQSIEEAVRLLRRPVPSQEELQRVVSTLQAMTEPLPGIPEPGTEEEDLLLVAATTLFLEPARSQQVRDALRAAIGPATFELLAGLLSFIRTAHFWTLMHPELTFEEDVEAMLHGHAKLSEILLDDPEASRCAMGQRVFDELAALRESVSMRDAVRESQEALQRLQELHHHRFSFLAIVGHELRNSISALRNAVNTLSLLPTEDHRLLELRGMLARQTSAVARIVDDLLDVSRLSLDKLSILPEPLDLRALVQSCVSDHAATFEAAGLVFRSEIPETPVPVRADPVRASQIVENLLTNALRFTPAPGEVSVRLKVAGSTVCMEVSDTGDGFDADMANALFLPFVQGPQGDHKHGGLGLGLAISRKIADLHGGALTASSPGRQRGARFTWTIALDTSSP